MAASVFVSPVAAVAAPPVRAVTTAPPFTLPQLVNSLGGPGHGDSYPSGVEIAADGSVVISDIGDSQIRKYAADGTLVWTTGSVPGFTTGFFNDPRDVGLDAAGEVFVADNANQRIVKLSATGQWITSWTGPSADKIISPIGVTVEGNQVLVADAEAEKIRVFNLSGTQLFTLQGSGACVFARPRDVDTDAAGNFYIANYTANNILKMSPTGQCLAVMGTRGAGPGQFSNPYGIKIATDPVLGSEAMYVADSNNERIEELTLAGQFVAQAGVPGTASQPGTFFTLRRVAVATDGSGDVWGADQWNWRLERFHRTPTGYTYAQTIGGHGPPLQPGHVFNLVGQAAVDTGGVMWAADTVNQRVVGIRPDGSIVTACGIRGDGPGQFNWPRGIAVDDATGQIWVADTKQSRLQVVIPSTCIGVYRLGGIGTAVGQFNWPRALVIRPSDRVAWVADSLNNRIESVDVATRTGIAVFGSLGSGVGQFNSPNGIGLDPTNGHIYVADTVNKRIVELADNHGTGITVVRVILDNFSAPNGVAVDQQGRIYVADTGHDRVVILAPDGTQLGVLGGMNFPEDVTVDRNGNLFVSDTYHDVVKEYSYGGPQPFSPPRYAGNFSGAALADMYPVDVAASATDYYVVDAGRYRVLAVNRQTGAIDGDWEAGQGTGPGQLGDARAIALDSAGNVYVADTPHNRVEKFNSQLTAYLGSFGSGGKGNGQFTQAYGLAIGQGLNASGQAGEILYVADGAGRIEKFDLAGNFISVFATGLHDPRQMDVNPVNHNLYVVNARDHQVVVYSQAGLQLFAFGSAGRGNGQFTGDPRGVTITPDGSKVMVTDSDDYRIEAFDASNGNYLWQVGSRGTGPGQFGGPRGLVVTADNVLLVTDEWGFGLDRFTISAGGATFASKLFGTPPPLPGVNSAKGLAADASGNVFISDWWNQRIERCTATGTNCISWGHRGASTGDPLAVNFAWGVAFQRTTGFVFLANRESHQIKVFDGNGNFVTQFGSRGSNQGQFLFPQGVTWDPVTDTILVADSGNARIQRFRVDAAANVTYLASYGTAGSGGPGLLNTPTTVAVAADGTLWVADTSNNDVQSMAPNGTWARFTGTAGSFAAPWGVTVAPDGTIWVTDTGNNRIVKMSPTGSLYWAADGNSLGSGPLNAPYQVLFSPTNANNILLTDTFNNRVIKLVAQ